MSLLNVLYSTFTFKCPRCNKGNLFSSKKIYSLKTVDKMHEHCSNCNLKYEQEVGFFYGAMYVAYSLVAGVFIISYLAYSFWLNAYFSELTYTIALAVFYISFAPITLRLSRALWLNLFIKYDSSFAKNDK